MALSLAPLTDHTGLPSPVTAFVLDVAERAGKSFLQGFALFAVAPAVVAGNLDVTQVHWLTGLDYGLGMAVLSLLTSLGSQPFGNGNSASLVKPPVVLNVPA